MRLLAVSSCSLEILNLKLDSRLDLADYIYWIYLHTYAPYVTYFHINTHTTFRGENGGKSDPERERSRFLVPTTPHSFAHFTRTVLCQSDIA